MAEKKPTTADISFDDDPQVGGIDLDDEGEATTHADSEGIALDDSEGGIGTGEATQIAAEESSFDEPMKLTYQDTERINDGRLSTATVLGLRDLNGLRVGKIPHSEVQKQLELFIRKLTNMERQYTDLKTAPTKFLEYGKWRQQIIDLKSDSNTAEQLGRMIDGEHEKVAMAKLTLAARVYVEDDGILEPTEHKKMLALAAQHGLTPAHIEEAYNPFKPFTDNRDKGGDWPAMKKLALPGEIGGWNLARLQDALVQRFDVAVEIANLDTESKYSLYTYLEDKDPKAAEHAKEAWRAAREVSSVQPHPLAVWYFLWATSPTPILHVTGKGHLPTTDRRRQIATLFELEILLANKNDETADDLARALAGGLLEHWLRFAIPNSTEAQQIAKQTSTEARKLPASKRQEFLRLGAQSVLRLLLKAAKPPSRPPQAREVTPGDLRRGAPLGHELKINGGLWKRIDAANIGDIAAETSHQMLYKGTLGRNRLKSTFPNGRTLEDDGVVHSGPLLVTLTGATPGHDLLLLLRVDVSQYFQVETLLNNEVVIMRQPEVDQKNCWRHETALIPGERVKDSTLHLARRPIAGSQGNLYALWVYQLVDQ